MPNRILREGILTSERINHLSESEEVFYRRLMSVIDDFGRYDARPSILRAALYPLRLNETTEVQITDYLEACSKQCLIRLYCADGKPYLELLDFRQQVRAKTSRWPAPEMQMRSTCVADEQHMLADAHLDGVGVVDGIGDGDGDGHHHTASPLNVPGLHEEDRWEVEVAFGNARKAGYDAEEINQTLTDFVRKGKALSNVTNYLIKTLQGKREAIASGKAPPRASAAKPEYLTDERPLENARHTPATKS